MNEAEGYEWGSQGGSAVPLPLGDMVQSDLCEALRRRHGSNKRRLGINVERHNACEGERLATCLLLYRANNAI